MKHLVLLLTLVAAHQASAQSAEAPAAEAPTSPPPLVPADVEPTYAQRCFAVPGQLWIPLPSGRYATAPARTTYPLTAYAPASPTIHGAVPLGTPSGTSTGSTSSSGSSSSSGGSGGGGLGDGKALIVLAVVVVAALPVIVYALDDDAPAVVENRFHCPSFGFDLTGGADFGTFGAAPSGTGRVNFGYAYLGADFQFDLTTASVRGYSSHLLLRIGPKKHIEPAIAAGFRWMTYNGEVRRGLELGVPHRYVFFRDGLREGGLEVRPTFQFSFPGFDVGLELAALIPLVEPLTLRVGGKIQTFGDALVGGVNAGLSLSL